MKKIRSFAGRRRPITVILLVLLGLVIGMIVFGFIPFSNALLKEKAEQLLKESLSGQCTIGKFRITLWKGVILSDVRYHSYGRENGAVKVSCSLPRMTLSYYLLPLLFKQVIINAISVEKPEIVIEWPELEAKRTTRVEVLSLATLSRVMATIPYTVLVRNISIVNAHIVVSQKGRVLASGEGIALSVKVGLKRALALEGRLSAADVLLCGNRRLTGCKASIGVTGAEVFVHDCRASLYGGELSIKGRADLSEGVLRSLAISLTDLKLNEWRRDAWTGPGELAGKLNASFDGETSLLVLDSLRGKGWIRATAVSARGAPLQKNLILQLAIPKLETLKFTTIYSDLCMKKGKIATRNFYGKGDPMDFTAEGWVDLNGRFSENMEGVFSADFCRSLPDIVRNSLLPVEQDKEKCSFKGAIGGTFDNPHVEVDQRIVKRAVNNVFDAIGRSLGNLFKK
jgi:hypothetical protein